MATLDVGGTLVLPLGGDGYVGNFLSFSKGVKDPFKVQEGICDFPRDTAVEKDLISPGEKNLRIFLDCNRFLSSYDGDIKIPLVWNSSSPATFQRYPNVSVHST